MDGFEVMTMDEASKIGDIFVTVTGCKDVIRKRHYANMKDGAILCNAGHFDVEVNLVELAELAKDRYEARRNIEGFVMEDGRTIFVLAEGRLVNLASGDGHPAEIMDMSFAVQAMSAKYLVDNKGKMPVDVIAVPRETDLRVATIKLRSLGIEIDALSEDQKDYLGI